MTEPRVWRLDDPEDCRRLERGLDPVFRNPTEFKNAALFSIRPWYLQRIASGKKKVIYQRQWFTREVSHAVLYETYPGTQKIVGYFEVAFVDKSSPLKIIERHDHNPFGPRKGLLKYFSGASQAMAVGIGKVFMLETPMPLDEIGLVYPAKGFQYLERELLEKVRVCYNIQGAFK